MDGLNRSVFIALVVVLAHLTAAWAVGVQIGAERSPGTLHGPSSCNTPDTRSNRNCIPQNSYVSEFESLIGAHGEAKYSRDFLLSATVPNTVNSDAAFEEWLCTYVSGSNDDHLYIDGPSGRIFRLPDCLTSTSFTTIRIYVPIILDTFHRFPSSLEYLDLTTTNFTPSFSSDDFHLDGTLNWQHLFSSVFTKVHTLSLGKSNLRGTLPERFPIGLHSFSIAASQLSGTIPSTLWSNLGSTFTPITVGFVFDIRDSYLEGSIPPGLFGSMAGFTLPSFYFLLARNRLSGSLPPDLFHSVQVRGSDFSVNLAFNQLDGIIPEQLFRSNLIQASGRTYVNMSSNNLHGPLPDSLMDGFYNQRSLSMFFDDNRLNGSVPTSFFPTYGMNLSIMSEFRFNVRNNRLATTIPPFLFSHTSDSSNSKLNSVQINLSSNRLYGSIPATLLRKSPTEGLNVSGSLLVDLNGNELTGSVFPSLLQDVLKPNAGTLNLNFASNQLTGPINPSIVDHVPSGVTMTLSLSNNRFSGLLPAFCKPSIRLKLHLQDNLFYGSMPTAWTAPCGLNELYLDSNSFLSGSLPSGLFTFVGGSRLLDFSAAYTNISGFLPRIPSIVNIDLSHTKVALCSDYSIPFVPGSNSKCLLRCTEAIHCPSNYSTCDTSCSDPSPLPGCASETRPSLDFLCIDGMWVAATTTAPSLTIPSGAGTVAVIGNVTASSVVFHGIGSTLFLNGCATNLTMIEVILAATDIEKLEKSKKLFQHLITFSSLDGNYLANCANFSAISLRSKTSSSSCKKITTEKTILDDRKTFGAYFTVDSSDCGHRWWIIVVAVVCVHTVAGTAAIVAGYLLWNRKKNADFKKISSGT